MSDIDTELENDQDTDTDLVRTLRSQLRAANKAIKETREQASQNEGAAKRVAFLDAGIPDTPQTKFFREHYSGPLEAEAIMAAASEYGFLDSVNAEAQANAAEIAAASEAITGGEIPGTGDDAEFRREMAEAAARGGDVGKNIEAVFRKYGRPVG